MKQPLKRVLIAIMILVVTISLLAGCASKGQLIGTWVPEDDVTNDYPTDYITFQDGGTGSGDGYTMTWYVDNGRLYITISNAFSKLSMDYEYSVSGNTLMLDGYKYRKTNG